MKTREILALTASFLLHVAVAALVLSLQTGNGHPGGTGYKKDGNNKHKGTKYDGVKINNVLEKEDKTEVTIIEQPPQDKNATVKLKPKPKPVVKSDDCPDHKYGGVGLEESYGTIVRVFRGYAADKAGLMAGDVIIGIDGGQLLGTPGTVANITIMRYGILMYFSIVRCWVCY